jgi:hypothetical protein
MSEASAKVKSELPGRGKEVEKKSEAWASEAGAKIDNAVRTSPTPTPDPAITSPRPIQRNNSPCLDPPVKSSFKEE